MFCKEVIKLADQKKEISIILNSGEEEQIRKHAEKQGQTIDVFLRDAAFEKIMKSQGQVLTPVEIRVLKKFVKERLEADSV